MDFNPEYVRLWTRHQAEVGRYVLTMIPREAAAGEVLQDVAVRLWEKWSEYDQERPVFAPDDSMGLFLLVGQSNMKGRGSVELEPETDQRILFFHMKEEAWFVARDPLHATGTPKKLDPRDNAGTGSGLTFAKAIAGTGSDAGIGLIPGAKGGAPINLYKEGKQLYTESLERTRKAIDQSGCKTEVRAILWLQGESDSGKRETVDAYEEKLLSLVDRYRRDFKDPELPFIACTIGSFIHEDEAKRKGLPFTREINEILLALPKRREFTACVDARDLKGHIGDHVHYNTESQVEIGKRFAKAYLEIWKQKRDSGN